MNHENPYRSALLFIAGLLIIGGGIAFIGGAAQASESVVALGANVVAAGFGALLLWVTVSAIGWRPTAAADEA